MNIDSSVLLSIIVALGVLLVLAATGILVLLSRHTPRERGPGLSQQRLLALSAADWPALDALPIPVAIRDQQGTCVRTNRVYRRSPAAAVAIDGHASRSVRPGAGSTGGLSLGQPRQIEYLSDDGNVRTGILWSYPISSDHGDPAGSVDMLIDTSPSPIQGTSSDAARSRFLELARHMSIVTFSFRRDTDGRQRLDFISGDLAALFRLKESDLLDVDDRLRDQPFHGSVHPEDAAVFENLLSFDAPARVVRSADFRTFGAHGMRWVHAQVALRRGPGENQTQLMGHFVDTTQANAHNEALRVARNVAERASRAKTDFLATMSHEIRTPMNGVMGMLELLGHTALGREQAELLRGINGSAGALLQILNDVLDFSKLEAGDMRLDIESFDPRMLLDHVAAMAGARIDAKGLRFQVAIDASLAGTLMGDSARLRQVLLNLLGNAEKFTEQGRILLKVVVVGDDGEHQDLRISVSDSGIGIPEGLQAGLFQPFNQAESSTSRRYGGSGLGLAICRQLVQLMEGGVELDSSQGVGTTVSVNLRLPVAQRERTSPASLRGRHAIVRLASADTAAMLTDYLAAMDITVECIPPPHALREGLSASFLFIGEEDRESGPQVNAHAIAVVDRPGAKTRGTLPHDRVTLDANPLGWQALTHACLSALDEEPVDAAPPPLAATRPAESHDAMDEERILVAEDHPMNQQVVQRQLEMLGWHCDVVDDGHQALEALQRNRYAMLLTDCNMAGMDGYRLATAWRAHEAASHSASRLPILAMTAHVLPNEMARCREAGMDDCLSKPLLLGPLQAKIRQWIPVSPPPAADPADDDVTGFDLMDGSTWPRDSVLAVLNETCHADLLEIDRAVAEGDIGTASHRLHRVLGALQLVTSDRLLQDGRGLLETHQQRPEADDPVAWRNHLGDVRSLLGQLNA